MQLFDYDELIHNAIMASDATIAIAPNGDQYVYADVSTIEVANVNQSLANEWYHSDYKDGYYMLITDVNGDQSTHYIPPGEIDEWMNAFSTFEEVIA